MCGIAGEYKFHDGVTSQVQLERANARHFHRGPDSGVTLQQGPISLAHRRLKIFDLSDKASQPMIDEELGLTLVFNGAIYNFRELREELHEKGYRFTSTGDTEVLLKAYHAWGEDCLNRLHGMFAFAVWDMTEKKLVIARDRTGIKPLYYAQTDAGFAFASTLPALLEFRGVDIGIDKTALHYYLTFHAVPEPLTMLRGVKKLMPGSILTIHEGGRQEQRTYWQLQIDESKTDYKRSEKDWVEATREALMLAIDRQLSADVPVGVLLSGGLYSSLLVALAAQIRGEHVETFSIGFEACNGEQGDEFYYSDLVSRQFNTKHHQMFISSKRLADELGNCVGSMSEPMISHDNIGFYLLSQEVSKHVKVVLSGQGADEIFAGYGWFQQLPHERLLPEQSAALIHNLVADREYAEYLYLVTPNTCTDDHASSYLRDLCRRNGSSSPIDNLLAYESGFALSNGPLGRVDNMTMASSLEARVPFLDEAVIDVATSMPLRYKLDDGGKAILKQLARQMLPAAVVDRPKGYFPVPALKYLQGSTLDLMREVLSPRNVASRGIFNQNAVRQLLTEPHDHLTPTGASKLWQIGLLEYWLQQHNL